MKHYRHEVRSISDLIPYINNSRTHSDDQVLQVAASIKEFGFTNPVLVDEQGGIIAGHGRVMAANKLGIEQVPCIVLDGLTEAQKKAYVIADNQLALNAGWDSDLLKIEIEALQELDFDISLLGFDDDILLTEEDCESEIIGQDYAEKFNILIECADESDQQEQYERLTKEGYKCRVQSL